MGVIDTIRRKRDGESLTREEIDLFVAGVTSGDIPDYQASALLMAIVLRGMSAQETAWLTGAMVKSGDRLDGSRIAGPKADKHSTGGVGDKTSLVLAPLAAACGVTVPMMSGRGLGHTGGTLDKLESIPGFRVDLTLEEVHRTLERVGCAMVGPTAGIVPADKRLYALRDVTATVESVPLITASIMSKKIAEGIDALVVDVKTGRGAFMKTEAEARRLAAALVAIGTGAGVRTEALLTTMDVPLGRAVGNALEVIESIETLKGRGPKDVEELSVLLAARMLRLTGVAGTDEEAERKVRGALTSGAGLEKWRQIVEAQGGDPRVVDDYQRLPISPRRHLISASRAGYLAALDAELIGRATVLLGAGRNRVDDVVDPAVGAMIITRPGAKVAAGDPLVVLNYRREAELQPAVALVEQAIEIADEAPAARPLVIGDVR